MNSNGITAEGAKVLAEALKVLLPASALEAKERVAIIEAIFFKPWSVINANELPCGRWMSPWSQYHCHWTRWMRVAITSPGYMHVEINAHNDAQAGVFMVLVLMYLGMFCRENFDWYLLCLFRYLRKTQNSRVSWCYKQVGAHAGRYTCNHLLKC